jgi:DNA-binding CsgD family transcriptional regulator
MPWKVERGRTQSGGSVTDEILGRDAELAAIASFLDRLEAGPVALVVEGEAGIGKTTLWEAGVAAAHRRGYPVLACRPVEAEATLSFAALGDLLDRVLDEVLAALPDPQRRAVEVALLRADAGEDPADQRAVSVATLGLLRLLARSGPLVVAIDDVQWLDGPSARVLEFAVRRLTCEPVGLLVSVRMTGGQAVPLRLEAWPPERVGRLLVGPLSAGALQRLVRSRLGRSLPRSVLLRVHEATAGNPLFAVEVVRVLLQRPDGLDPGQGLPVPEGLRQLVRLRLDGLPAQARRALLPISALTRSTLAMVEQATGAPVLVRRGLGKAADTGVIELDGDVVRFTHPLLRSVVYADASSQQRRRLHRRLAQVVVDPEEHARHLALGTDRPDAGVAQTLEEAAVLARARGAPAAAAELLELAGKRTPAARAQDRWRRTLDAGRYRFEAGDTQRARTLLETAVATAASHDARAQARQRLAAVLHDSDGPLQSVPVLEHALVEAGANRRLRTEVERELAHDLWLRGDLADARRHARAAVELAGDIGEPAALVTTATNQTLLDAAAGGVTPEILERARSLAAAAPASSGAAQLTMVERAEEVLALLLMVAGELDQARDIYLDQLEQASQRGDDHRREYLAWCLARVEVRAGDFQRAAVYAEESDLEAAGQEGLACETLGARAEVAALLGRVEVAHRAAGEGLAIAERRGLGLAALRNRAVLGFLELSLGNPANAHRWLGPAVAAMGQMGLGEPAYIPLLPDEIEALIALGELEQAASLIDLLEERGRALDRPWALAAAARGRGLLRAARGEQAAALEALQQALGEHDRMAQPFELGRTLLAKGTIERRARKWGAARASLEGALTHFEELRAVLWVDRAWAELRRVGGRAPARQLTPTEERVAELVSTGLTNREVAAALFMSVRTVEANLSRIYHKLGVRSRTEVHAKLNSEDASDWGTHGID